VSAYGDRETPMSEPRFVGHEAIDQRGEKVGTVTDVLSDDETGEPAWAVVSTGLLHTEHYVPMIDAYESDQGRLVLAFDKDMVKGSPKAHREHVLVRADEEELRRYYGLAA
jgi:sporulation protein YlmC with PRC-barrel domain